MKGGGPTNNVSTCVLFSDEKIKYKFTCFSTACPHHISIGCSAVEQSECVRRRKRERQRERATDRMGRKNIIQMRITMTPTLIAYARLLFFSSVMVKMIF